MPAMARGVFLVDRDGLGIAPDAITGGTEDDPRRRNHDAAEVRVVLGIECRELGLAERGDLRQIRRRVEVFTGAIVPAGNHPRTREILRRLDLDVPCQIALRKSCAGSRKRDALEQRVLL